jgi:hypothetical protein
MMHREKRGHSGTIELSQEGRRTRYKTTGRKKSKRGRTRKAWISYTTRGHARGIPDGGDRKWEATHPEETAGRKAKTAGRPTEKEPGHKQATGRPKKGIARK